MIHIDICSAGSLDIGTFLERHQYEEHKTNISIGFSVAEPTIHFENVFKERIAADPVSQYRLF
jgi:hypothetical protein